MVCKNNLTLIQDTYINLVLEHGNLSLRNGVVERTYQVKICNGLLQRGQNVSQKERAQHSTIMALGLQQKQLRTPRKERLQEDLLVCVSYYILGNL